MSILRCIFLATIYLCCGGMQSKAQQTLDTTGLFKEIRRMNDMYMAKGVSFDVDYTYTSEKNPGEVLDTMKAHIDMNGSNVHYIIDSTETLSNGKYNIALFREDKIMYLSKPVAGNTIDPTQQIRAVIGDSTIVNCTVNTEGKYRNIKIGFRPDAPCRQMDLSIDVNTGYLVSMQYIVKTEMLMDTKNPDVSVEQIYGQYAIVKSIYSGYRYFSPDPGFFDESRFFYKEGKELKASQPYAEYKVFVGSPDL